MSFLSEPNWSDMFSFSLPPLELIIRGTVMYWFIFMLMRIGGRRDIGTLGVADMLVLVLIADAAQNGMAGSYESVLDGMVLVGTIAAWATLIDRATYVSPRLARLLTASRICLIRDGVVCKRSLRRELITEDELISELHQQGFDDIRQVRRAYIEADGNISVLPGRQGQRSRRPL